MWKQHGGTLGSRHREPKGPCSSELLECCIKSTGCLLYNSQGSSWAVLKRKRDSAWQSVMVTLTLSFSGLGRKPGPHCGCSQWGGGCAEESNRNDTGHGPACMSQLFQTQEASPELDDLDLIQWQHFLGCLWTHAYWTNWPSHKSILYLAITVFCVSSGSCPLFIDAGLDLPSSSLSLPSAGLSSRHHQAQPQGNF